MDDFLRGALRAALVMLGVFPMCGALPAMFFAETWTGRIVLGAIGLAGFLWARWAYRLWRDQ
jgi:hypothetical protein